MVTKKYEQTAFYQCLRVSWVFVSMIALIVVSKILGFIDVPMIALLAIPCGLLAMCASLLAVTQSGEAVEIERRDPTHH